MKHIKALFPNLTPVRETNIVVTYDFMIEKDVTTSVYIRDESVTIRNAPKHKQYVEYYHFSFKPTPVGDLKIGATHVLEPYSKTADLPPILKGNELLGLVRNIYSPNWIPEGNQFYSVKSLCEFWDTFDPYTTYDAEWLRANRMVMRMFVYYLEQQGVPLQNVTIEEAFRIVCELFAPTTLMFTNFTGRDVADAVIHFPENWCDAPLDFKSFLVYNLGPEALTQEMAEAVIHMRTPFSLKVASLIAPYMNPHVALPLFENPNGYFITREGVSMDNHYDASFDGFDRLFSRLTLEQQTTLLLQENVSKSELTPGEVLDTFNTFTDEELETMEPSLCYDTWDDLQGTLAPFLLQKKW